MVSYISLRNTHYFSVSPGPIISSWISSTFQASVWCHQNSIYPSNTSAWGNLMSHSFQSPSNLLADGTGFWLDNIRFPLMVYPFGVYGFCHIHVMGDDIQYSLEDRGDYSRAPRCPYDHKEIGRASCRERVKISEYGG